MAHLQLFLFGTPRIEREGVTVNVDTRKAVALLAYLAVTRQRHSRDALAALLWPDYDQPHARATLRRTLSALNKALAGQCLDIDRETIGLDYRSGLWVDVDEFHNYIANCRSHQHAATESCQSCLEPLAKAAVLYAGDFMAGFNLNDSSNFDDWQFFQADTLRRELASMLERLVYCLSATANFEAAISYGRRWLSLDRLHEPAHRALMQLFAWSGQRTAALHQYQECAQTLEEELGVAPLEATTQLYKDIKANQVMPAPTPSLATVMAATASSQLASTMPEVEDDSFNSTPSTMLGYTSYPLVGRQAEWDTLVQAYTDSSQQGRMIIVEGEAGIGKTRLAGELTNYAHARGATVIVARCYEGEMSLAYGPIIAALREALGQQHTHEWRQKVAPHWISEATRLLPELATLVPGLPPTPPLDSPGAQNHFFEGLRQLLAALCGNGAKAGVAEASLLFFDDVQWADNASLDFLGYIARRLYENHICLLLTWRNVQLAAAAISPRHQQLVTEAQRSGRLTLISLSRLSQSTIKELVQSIAPAMIEPPTGLIARLYQETEGLPFFLVEYLLAMQKGTLTAEDDNWALPHGVRDLLTSRLAAIDGASGQLLSTAAIIGRSFDYDTLREVSGRSEEETITALEELIEQGLVVEMRVSTGAASNTRALQLQQSTPVYDFCHEKLRTLVYEETSLARRRLLHRRVAEVLIAQMRGQRSVTVLPGLIAYHYQMAGNTSAAAEYYQQAGERARQLYAHTEALAHFRLALALGYPATAALHEAIGDLHTFLGEYGAALKSYETAISMCTTPEIANLEHKMGAVYMRRGELVSAEQHFETALHMLDQSGQADERAKIYADWSLAAYHRGHIDQALDFAQRALDVAEVAHDTRALAQAHNILGILASSQGETESAYEHLEQSLSLAESQNDVSTRAAALNNLALVCKASGRVERALTLAEAALVLCNTLGDRHHEAALHSNLADLLHDMGRVEESMAHLKQAVSIYAEIGVEAGTVQPEIWKLAEW